MRCADGAGGEDDFVFGFGEEFSVVFAAGFDAYAAAAFDHQFCHCGKFTDGEIGAMANRVEEGLARMPTHTALLCDFKFAGTFVAAGVEVATARNACLDCRVGEAVEDVPAQALRFDAQFATGAVVFTGSSEIVFVLLV